MKFTFKSLLVMAMLLFGYLKSNAQSLRKLSGIVTDSTKLGVSWANVQLVSDRDTMRTGTDAQGRFSFNNIKSDKVTLIVNALGYSSFVGYYTFKAGQTELNLGAIFLRGTENSLNEVEIKGRVNPVKVKKDTLEYNAGAFRLRKNDRVEDLLRQLPGIEVDAEGNVTSNGKILTKIRVNGKDFFTGNVKDFIRQIPAELIAKLQVIDDYGDAANFTGNKDGKPQKLLNLVTKAKKEGGYFGNVTLAGGSNDRYNLLAEGNSWKEKQHIGIKGQMGNTGEGGGLLNLGTAAGLNNNKNASLNYRNNFGKSWSLATDYRYSNLQNQVSKQSEMTTFNEQGTIYSADTSLSRKTNENHVFLMELKSESVQDFFTLGLNGRLGRNKNFQEMLSRQSGLIRQDLFTASGQQQLIPSYDAAVNWARKISRPDRVFSIRLSGGEHKQNGKDTLNNRISYYDQGTGLPVKDSVLNRLLQNEQNRTTFKTEISYTEPLNKPRDSIKKSLGMFYNYAVNGFANNLQTRVGIGYNRLVDSLSNNYSSTFQSHYIGLQFKYESKKLNYQLKVSLQPNLLNGDGAGNAAPISRSDLNVGGALFLSYLPGSGQQLQLLYFGDNTPPRIEQLQPVPDTRNLQNFVIGNPGLRSEFNHSVYLSYNYVAPGTGLAMQLAVDGALVQNMVVSNVRLITDTLGSLKQETRFLNANGNYTMGNSLNLSVPLSGNKYLLELKGRLQANNLTVYIDDVRYLSKEFQHSLGLDFRINKKILSLKSGAEYSSSANKYTLGLQQSSTINSWMFKSEGKLFFSETCFFGLDIRKSLYKGYGVGATDPFILNASLEQAFLKKKQAIARLQAFDVFNQGNFLQRQMSANTITDTRANQLTRYVLLSLIYRVDQFGRK